MGYSSSSSSALTLLSHQTGLSAAVTTAFTPYNIGSSITVTRSGLMYIDLKGHVSADTGVLDFTLKRAGTVYYFWGFQATAHTATVLGDSSFVDSLWSNPSSDNSGISNTVTGSLLPNLYVYSGSFNTFLLIPMPVISNDVIQFRASNTTGGPSVYIDEMVVILQ